MRPRAVRCVPKPTETRCAAQQPRARRPTPTSWLLRVHTLQRACERTVDQGEGRWVRRVGWPGRAQGQPTQIVPAECLQYRHSVRTRLSVTHWRVGGVLQHGHPCASHNLQGNASSTHASRAQPTAAATLIHRLCGGCPQARTYLAVSTRREHGVSAAIASPFLGENHTSDPTVCRVPVSLKFVA